MQGKLVSEGEARREESTLKGECACAVSDRVNRRPAHKEVTRAFPYDRYRRTW